MNRCKDCKWWAQIGSGVKGWDERVCRRNYDAEFEDATGKTHWPKGPAYIWVQDYDISEYARKWRPQLLTWPNFGCTEWKAKE